MSGKCRQKLLDHAKEFDKDGLKAASARAIIGYTTANHLNF